METKAMNLSHFNGVDLVGLDKLIPKDMTLAEKLIQFFATLSRAGRGEGEVSGVVEDFFKSNEIPIDEQDLSLLIENIKNSKTCLGQSKGTSDRPVDPKGILEAGKLQPEFSDKIATLLKTAQEQGLPVFLFEGYRSFATQDRLYQGGRGVTNARAGDSYHNYGLAADIVFYDDQGNPSWSEGHDWQRLGQIGKGLGLVWGGDFKSISDRSHFEYHPGMSLHDVKRIYNEKGAAGIWEKLSQQGNF